MIGYSGVFGPVVVRPSLGLAYTGLYQDAYEEEGGNAINLAIDASDFQSLRSQAELRIGANLGSGTVWTPYLRGGWSHEFLDVTPVADVHFVAGGASFSLEGDPLDKDVPFAGAGLAAAIGHARLSLDCTGRFDDRLTSHQATATVSMAF